MKPWVDGWLSQLLLIACCAVALWFRQTTPATIYVVGAVVIGVIRQIERTRRASSGTLPPG